jgi:hypothetical protein
MAWPKSAVPARPVWPRHLHTTWPVRLPGGWWPATARAATEAALRLRLARHGRRLLRPRLATHTASSARRSRPRAAHTGGDRIHGRVQRRLRRRPRLGAGGRIHGGGRAPSARSRGGCTPSAHGDGTRMPGLRLCLWHPLARLQDSGSVSRRRRLGLRARSAWRDHAPGRQRWPCSGYRHQRLLRPVGGGVWTGGQASMPDTERRRRLALNPIVSREAVPVPLYVAWEGIRLCKLHKPLYFMLIT